MERLLPAGNYVLNQQLKLCIAQKQSSILSDHIVIGSLRRIVGMIFNHYKFPQQGTSLITLLVTMMIFSTLFLFNQWVSYQRKVR